MKLSRTTFSFFWRLDFASTDASVLTAGVGALFFAGFAGFAGFAVFGAGAFDFVFAAGSAFTAVLSAALRAD
ncbi:hypothetical protein [Caballeronia terrestris]|uniref:hypothetical protein n=1 Tax=Caballeronia terrestris TaxID=1226301 RepID=UPI002E108004